LIQRKITGRPTKGKENTKNIRSEKAIIDKSSEINRLRLCVYHGYNNILFISSMYRRRFNYTNKRTTII